MGRRKRAGRIYWRCQGSDRCNAEARPACESCRAYGDFRDFEDVGGGREALVPQGETMATRDPDVAARVASDRVEELESKRRNRTILGIERDESFEQFASEHLVKKSESGEVSDAWLAAHELRLRRALEFFGADRDLNSISAADVKRWIAVLRRRRGRGGRAFSDSTVRHHLNALSNLYKAAGEEGLVQPGVNPVAVLSTKPTGARAEADWLEAHAAALVLEALPRSRASSWRPHRSSVPSGRTRASRGGGQRRARQHRSPQAIGGLR